MLHVREPPSPPVMRKDWKMTRKMEKRWKKSKR
jgi:hypothetical protein